MFKVTKLNKYDYYSVSVFVQLVFIPCWAPKREPLNVTGACFYGLDALPATKHTMSEH